MVSSTGIIFARIRVTKGFSALESTLVGNFAIVCSTSMLEFKLEILSVLLKKITFQLCSWLEVSPTAEPLCLTLQLLRRNVLAPFSPNSGFSATPWHETRWEIVHNWHVQNSLLTGKSTGIWQEPLSSHSGLLKFPSRPLETADFTGLDLSY
jgi:hypothetical protein